MKQRKSHTACVFNYEALKQAGFNVLDNGNELTIEVSTQARPILAETTMQAIVADAQNADVPEDKFIDALDAMQRALQLGLILNIAMGDKQ